MDALAISIVRPSAIELQADDTILSAIGCIAGGSGTEYQSTWLRLLACPQTLLPTFWPACVHVHNVHTMCTRAYVQVHTTCT